MGCLRCLTYAVVVVALAVAGLLHVGRHYSDMNGMIPILATEVNFGLSDMPDLTGRVVLVTGANTGLGFDSAKHLAGAGAKTILGCRNPKKCQKAAERIQAVHPKADLLVAVMDLSSLASVQKAANDLLANEDITAGIDILLLNAGVMAPPHTITGDGLELQFGTNHVGHSYLTQKLLPLVRKAAEAHGHATITVVSSLAHTFPNTRMDTVPLGLYLSEEDLNKEENYEPTFYYGVSKLANVLFANELSTRLGDGKENIFVNSLHPGGVATDLSRHVEERVSQFLPRVAVDALMGIMTSVVWSPDEAAFTQLYTSVSPDIVQKRITGKYFHPIAKMHPPSSQATDIFAQKALWDFTDQILAKRGFTDVEAVSRPQ